MDEKFHTKVKVTKDFKTIGIIKVEWRVSIDMREWGLKGIMVSCPDQVCPFESIEEVDTDREDERGNVIYEPATTDTEIKLENVEVDIFMGDRKMNSDLCPVEIEIYKGKTQLLFQ